MSIVKRSMRAKTIIENANIFLEKENHRKLVFQFLEKFSQCEVYVRPVLKEYLLNEDPNIKEEEIGLEYRQIINAFSENGIYFCDKKIVSDIFGSNDKVNESSCKWLRNKITHSLMQRALKEVCCRYDVLIDNMDTFIKTIEQQV